MQFCLDISLNLAICRPITGFMENITPAQKPSKTLKPLWSLYFENIGITATFVPDNKEAAANFKRAAREAGKTIPEHLLNELSLFCILGKLEE
jgi:hypothetical protein